VCFEEHHQLSKKHVFSRKRAFLTLKFRPAGFDQHDETLLRGP
jgi:hypothetical protein